MKKLFLIPITFFLLSSSFSNAQNKKVVQPELDSGTIEEQFDYIITKSSSYKEFQLIRKTSILKVKDHALDSIKIARKEIQTAQKRANTAEAKMKSLESTISTLTNEVEAADEEIDTISFFGIPLSKTSYNTIMWSIIIVLLILLALFIFQFKKSSMVTNQSKNELEKIENEYETFRKNALKKEQETMRKLQDEINKNNP